MSEKQFDIFDEPFRKAAGQYEPEFSEAAWKKMEAKLDGGPKRRKPFAWFWWFPDLIMITLLVTLLFELYSGKSTVSNAPLLPANAIQGHGEKIKNEPGERIVPQTSSKEEPGETNEIRVRENFDKPVLVKNTTKASSYKPGSPTKNETPYGNKIQAGAYHQPAPVRNQNDRLQENGDQLPLEKQEGLADDKTVTAAEMKYKPEDPGVAPLNETTVNSNTEPATQPAVAGTGKSSVPSPADSAVSPIPGPASTTTGIVKPRLRPFKGFYVQAGLAPEWSFIAGNSPGPITAAYGGSAGYAFGNRWSVQAGIFSTLKDYEAGPGDYKAKPGSYYATVKIFHVDAECRITELPLLVNYQILARGRQTLSATAGFASLIMKKETYDYHYERWNGMQAYSEHSYKTNAFHPFASLFLGGAYGFNLKENLSLSAAPYLKIPLYGVGEGNVKITSAGLMFGLQYGISSRKNDKKAKAAPVQK